MRTTSVGGQPPVRKRTLVEKAAAGTIKFLDYEVLSIIFSFLDIFDLVHCSVVCKLWNNVIDDLKLLRECCRKHYAMRGRVSDDPTFNNTWRLRVEELGMERHARFLQEGQVDINQWKGHSTGFSQCRIKMGSILTGVGDKVLRLWSSENYKCLGEYTVPDRVSLVDYDFDESKIVGLIGTRLCLWRSSGPRSIFPSSEGTFPKGLCMRYVDPEAVIGCEDGSVRVFDMYSRKCSRVIRMHYGPITCLSLSEDQLIFSGSSAGSITVSGLSSNEEVANLRSTDLLRGIKTLSFNPRSNMLFAGSSTGHVSCWDIRKMRTLWEVKVCPNVIYSLGHMQNDRTSLVVGGIDGVLRVLDQNSGAVLSSYVIDHSVTPSTSSGNVEKRKGVRISGDFEMDRIPRTARPQITSVAVGMGKVVTAHNWKNIRVWKFSI